jgi:hypothetical protein
MDIKFFFFVNSKSGGQKGKILLKSFPKRVFLKNEPFQEIAGYTELRNIDAAFYDMF